MLVKPNQRSAALIINNEKGMATVETIPLLLLFVLLISYTMGAFGIVHTGIKNSIAARNYAFETFRNRSNLIYFRDNSGGALRHFAKNGNRTHSIASEAVQVNEDFIATERPLRVGLPFSSDDLKNHRGGSAVSIHNDQLFAANSVVAGKRINQKLEVNPVWVNMQYGICINVACGD